MSSSSSSSALPPPRDMLEMNSLNQSKTIKSCLLKRSHRQKKSKIRIPKQIQKRESKNIFHTNRDLSHYAPHNSKIVVLSLFRYSEEETTGRLSIARKVWKNSRNSRLVLDQIAAPFAEVKLQSNGTSQTSEIPSSSLRKVRKQPFCSSHRDQNWPLET